MRDVPTPITDALATGDFTGNARPVARVTVQHPMMRLHSYGGDRSAPEFSSPTGTPVRYPKTSDPAQQIYANFLFSNTAVPLELPNVKSVSWDRSSSNPVAEATVEMWNTEPLPLDAQPVWAWNGIPDLDQPGYFTYNRGKSQFSPRWGHLPNQFAKMLMPDNLVRVFEGYGANWSVAPESDPHLVQTGVWIIDDVIPNANGSLTIRMRDAGRLLADHLAWLPVVPRDFYPLEFKMVDKTSGYVEGQTVVTKVTVGLSGQYKITKPTPPKKPVAQPPVHTKNRVHLKARACSNDVWGKTNLYGHTLAMAFDSSTASWWVSVGNDAPTRRFAYEWVEASAGNKEISEVRFTPQKSGYTAYLSIYSGGKWHKTKAGGHINYHRDGIGKNGADIDYVAKLVCNKGQREYVFKLANPMKASRVRVTLSNLQDFNLGVFQYRAGIRDVRAYGYSTTARPVTRAQRNAYNAAEKAYQAALARYTDQKDKISDIVSPFVRGIQDDFERKDTESLVVAQTRDKWIQRGRYGIRATDALRLDDKGYTFPATWCELDYRHQQVDVRFTGQLDVTAVLRVSNSGGLGMIRVRFLADRVDVEVVNAGTSVATFSAPATTAAAGWGRVLIEDKKLTVLVRAPSASVPIPARAPLDPGFAVVLAVTDDTFSDLSMGTGAGFDGRVEHFRAWGILKGGAFDSFSRLNDVALRQAESGHAWRLAALDATLGFGITNQAAHRTGANDGREVYAVARLGTHSQTVFSRYARGSGTAGKAQIWLLRYASAGNFVGVRMTADNYFEIFSMRNGVQTIVSTRTTGTTPVGTVEIKLEGQALELRHGTDPDAGGNPLVRTVTSPALDHDLLGTYAGIGAEHNNLTFDNVSFTDHTTTGGGPGETDDPTTTVISYETYIPAHIEPGAGAKPGTYEDYTDLVKIFCCWAGLYWPKEGMQVYSDGTVRTLAPEKTDPVLGRELVGRAWGDFEVVGTAGPTPLGTAIWDKKYLLDCIRYVQDITGFLFVVDETGAVIWRLPNYYTKGNWVSAMSASPRRTPDIITLDEATNVLDLGATLSSRNMRERVFVSDTLAKYGGMAAGFNPNPVGMRRVGGWTDQHFASDDECRLMADMITIRQMFTYRTDSVTIPADPRIQVDDQVRVYERVTSEGYLHYVDGVSSNLDMVSGQWQYSLKLFWLGDDPFKHWAVDWTQLHAETQDYLALMRFEADNYKPEPRPDTGVALAKPKIISPKSTIVFAGWPVGFTIAATGQPAPALSITGTLPAGLHFKDNHDGYGLITGTATVAVTRTVTVNAVNSQGTVTQALTITVQPGSKPFFTSGYEDTMTKGNLSGYAIRVGGTPTPKITISGTLPPGTAFHDNGDGTAAIAGRPTRAGRYYLNQVARNSVGTASMSLVIDVVNP